jgi:hypothetical protein
MQLRRYDSADLVDGRSGVASGDPRCPGLIARLWPRPLLCCAVAVGRQAGRCRRSSAASRTSRAVELAGPDADKFDDHVFFGVGADADAQGGAVDEPSLPAALRVVRAELPAMSVAEMFSKPLPDLVGSQAGAGTYRDGPSTGSRSANLVLLVDDGQACGQRLQLAVVRDERLPADELSNAGAQHSRTAAR